MNEYQRGGIEFYSSFDNLTGGNRTGVHRARGEVNGIDNLVLTVEVDNFESLFLKAPH